MNTLYYIHDPMCSWCWGFRPVWQVTRQALREYYGDCLQICGVLGGLAPDSSEPMPAQTRDYVQANWRRIQEVIPGTQFNYDFWQQCQPRRSTYPACRAVIAAVSISPEAEWDMIEAIQRAYYLEASNPSDEPILRQCAKAIGLDGQQFIERLHSDSTQESLEQHLALYQQFALKAGVSGFPSLVLVTASGANVIPVDYHDCEVIVRAVHQALA